MAGRPYVLHETNWKEVQPTHYDVAILPWGATEAHNFHLPFGTDTIQVNAIAIESARRAWDSGHKVIVLPAIPFGVNTQQLGIGPAINMNPSTQAIVLADIIESLEAAEIPRLLLINGHGGNDFKQMIREAQAQTEIFLCALNWYAIVDGQTYFDEPGDHAGEMETSMIQFLAPELPLPLKEAGTGESIPWRLQGLREKWVWAPRDWRNATVDTGVGDPSKARPEKGVAYFEAVTRKIATFLNELAESDPQNLYGRGGS
jgi:creatinine amidohydrolase